MSDDGAHALTVIAMLGNVFSPAFARARARGEAHPLRHSTMNVALYGRPSGFALTERREHEVFREPRCLRIGESTVTASENEVRVSLRERAAIGGSVIVGMLIVRPNSISTTVHALDARDRHRWQPIARDADVEVELREPRLTFRGRGYLDGNHGDEPLEDAFTGWSWARGGDGRTSYDVRRRDGTRLILGAGEDQRLGRTGWGLDRRVVWDEPVRVTRTLEDTPFYARSLLASPRGPIVHEELSLDRFRRGWVRFLVPFRMRGGR